MEVTVPELVAGGSLFALVLAAVVRVMQGDRDWRALVIAERQSREDAEERLDKERLHRVAVETELRLRQRELDDVEDANRELRVAMRQLGTREGDRVDLPRPGGRRDDDPPG